MTADRRLPEGFGVRLRHDVRRLESGRLLVGGSPLRVLRLSEAAGRLLQAGLLQVTGTASEQLAARLLDGNLADPVPGAPANRADITVVVPVRDRAEQLDRCLTSLEPLSCVVVDDASRDPGAIHAVARRHGCRTVALSQNLGPAGARNAGLQVVDTPLVAFVDSDVTVDASQLLTLTQHFADDRVALVGPAVRGVVSSACPRWFERYDAEASSLDLGPEPAMVGPGARVAWVPSACLVGRVDRLGDGFDETMRVAEDVDLVWRLVLGGAAVRYDPTVVALHDVRPTFLGWLGRKFIYGTGGAALAARHGDVGAPAVLSAPMALAAAMVLLRSRSAVPTVAVVLGHGLHDVANKLPATPARHGVAAWIVVQGLGWAVRQESALLLRHWWPLALMGAVVSRSARRMLVSALLVDTWVAGRRRRELSVGLKMVARRFDDLAYGAGLWTGALRQRSLRCLAIRRRRS